MFLLLQRSHTLRTLSCKKIPGCFWTCLFIHTLTSALNLGNWCLITYTVYPKKYAHGFVVLCFVMVMQSFIMNSHEVFIHIHQGCFAGTGAIVSLSQCQWSKPDGYGKISQCITTTKHSKAKTVCISLGIYCIDWYNYVSMDLWRCPKRRFMWLITNIFRVVSTNGMFSCLLHSNLYTYPTHTEI